MKVSEQYRILSVSFINMVRWCKLGAKTWKWSTLHQVFLHFSLLVSFYKGFSWCFKWHHQPVGRTGTGFAATLVLGHWWSSISRIHKMVRVRKQSNTCTMKKLWKPSARSSKCMGQSNINLLNLQTTRRMIKKQQHHSYISIYLSLSHTHI